MDVKKRTRLNLLILIRSLAIPAQKSNIYFLRQNKNVQKYFTGFKKKKEGKGQKSVFR